MTLVTSKQVAPRGEVLGDVVFDKLVDSSNGRLGSPYVDINTDTKLKAMASTGSLGDYLNIPTTLVGRYGTYSARYESYMNGASWLFPKIPISAATLSEYVTGWGSSTLRLSSLDPYSGNLGEVSSSLSSGVSFNGIVSLSMVMYRKLRICR